MAFGPDKIRRRTTLAIDAVNGSVRLEHDDYDLFYNFYNTTLAGGTKGFYFNDPITQVQTVYRFKSEPRISSMGGEYFNISMSWEKIAWEI